MNVLILDDQRAVLDGLKNGIDWDANGISRLFLTSSADDARRIFQQEEIHIFFCDIEMPEENGISMVKWVTALRFHQKLSQLFLHILSLRNQDLSKIFTESYTYADFSSSYQTIHELQNAVDFVFTTLSGLQENSASYADRARDYVMANLNENIQVQDIADYIGLTPDYLSRYFKKETGTSLKDFILSVKVDAAKQRLKNADRSVSAIALELGYDNASKFIHTFKKSRESLPTNTKSSFRQSFLSALAFFSFRPTTDALAFDQPSRSPDAQGKPLKAKNFQGFW